MGMSSNFPLQEFQELFDGHSGLPDDAF